MVSVNQHRVGNAQMRKFVLVGFVLILSLVFLLLIIAGTLMMVKSTNCESQVQVTTLGDPFHQILYNVHPYQICTLC